MLRFLLLIVVFTFTSVVSAQEDEAIIEETAESLETETETANVPFAVIDNVPVYPGCKGEDNVVLKNCMSAKITEHIKRNFDMKKIYAIGLIPKIYRNAVQFKIDKNGEVVDVHATSAHPEIGAEAERVISSLPKMIPGRQRGQNVGVVYAIPIVFEIEPPKRSRNKKSKKSNRK